MEGLGSGLLLREDRGHEGRASLPVRSVTGDSAQGGAVPRDGQRGEGHVSPL